MAPLCRISTELLKFLKIFAIFISIEVMNTIHLFADAKQSADQLNSNRNIASRETINHVRHQHEQTIGNIHVLTNIDIANLITILNGSQPVAPVGEPNYATAGRLKHISFPSLSNSKKKNRNCWVLKTI